MMPMNTLRRVYFISESSTILGAYMNTQSSNYSIGIADDHSLIIEGIKTMLEGEPYHVIIQSQSLLELNQLLRVNPIDMLLLDINFNGNNSLDQLENYRHLYPQLKIIICTSYDSEAFITDALNKGKYESLTKREKEITAQLIDLKTTDQIAERLYISPNTVHTHRKSIFKKLNIHSTADLIKQYHLKE